MILNVSADNVIKFTAKLERMNRSALPVVIRSTLNKAAYDVKTNTMLTESDVFIHRKPTFFKANSKVEQAQGFDVDAMVAIVGFIPKDDALDTSVADLEEQEHGGIIKGRAFIPINPNRVGNAWTGNVKKAGRIRALEAKIRDSKDSKAPTPEAQFTDTRRRVGVGGLVIGNRLTAKGNKLVWKILQGGKMEPLFVVKAHRQVHPQATHFMEKASNLTAEKMEDFYIVIADQKLKALK